MHPASPNTGQPLVIFLHHMKTGGTTLRRIIRRQYPPGAALSVVHRHFDFSSDQFDRVGAAVRERDVRLVQGHIPFGLHERWQVDATYVTLLREPVDRVVSLYYYMLQQHQADFLQDGRPIGLERFIKSERAIAMEVDNAQTRRLSGLNPEFGRCSREMLDRAREHLHRHFSVVGVTEQFDQTLILLQKTFGWRYPLYTRDNVTRSREKKEALAPGTIELVERYNELDRELYDEARAMLADQIRRHEPEFERDLATFTRLNAAYAAGRLTWDEPAEPAADRESEAIEAELRASLAVEHRHLLARKEWLEGEIQRVRARKDGLKEEARRLRKREVELAREIERRRARADERAGQIAALRDELAAARAEQAVLGEELEGVRERGRTTRLGRLRARYRQVRAWAGARAGPAGR